MKKLSQKKILVLGLGKSGRKSYELLQLLGIPAVTLYDDNEKLRNDLAPLPYPWPSLEELLALIPQLDLIVLSPGIGQDHPIITSAIAHKIPFWTEIELGHQFISHEKIIAVTGTNGKTTTVSLLHEMFRRAHLPSFLGGNIGTPFCSYAIDLIKNRPPCPYLILELSSFQLETVDQFHAHFAAILNISANHEERYQGVHDYFAAKLRILNRMEEADHFLYPSDEPLFNDAFTETKAQLHHFNSEDAASEIGKYFTLHHFHLKGRHNISNLYVAFRLFQLAVPDWQRHLSAIQETIDSFAGVDFRIQSISNHKKNYRVYNDAKSTNFDATVTAINALKDDRLPLYLIVGGKYKALTENEMIKLTNALKYVTKVFLIGETTDYLRPILEKESIPFLEAGTAKKCVELIDQEGNFQGNLLFSPGFQSFDQYKNYIERGQQFTQLIQGHAR